MPKSPLLVATSPCVKFNLRSTGNKMADVSQEVIVLEIAGEINVIGIR